MLNNPGTFVNPQPKYLELSKWLKQMETAPKQIIQSHLNSFQILKVPFSVQTTFWWETILPYNIWVNFLIFHNCPSALNISEQK
jgi:hypothetical protein